MKKINLAIIGAGPVVQYCHLPVILKNHKINLNCIVDKDEILLDKISKKYLIPHKYNNFNKLIKNSHIFDAALIALDPSQNLRIVKKLSTLKKSILIEKPGATNLADMIKIINYSEKNKSFIQIGYMKLFDKSLKKLRTDIKKDMSIAVHNHFMSYGGKAFASDFVKKRKKNSQVRVSKKIKDKKYFLKWLNTHSHVISYLHHIYRDLRFYKVLMFEKKIILLFQTKKNFIQVDSGFIFSRKWNEKIIINTVNHKKELVFGPNNNMKKFNIFFKIKTKRIIYRSYISQMFKEQLDYFTNMILKNKKNNYFLNNAFKVIKTVETIFRNV